MNNLYSTKNSVGATDYYYWGLNCQILKLTDDECRTVLNMYDPEMSLDDRDLFWHGFVNARVRTVQDFTTFPVYVTQGGGIAKYDKQDDRYVFVVPPAAGTNLGVHDVVPTEWSVHPANNKVDDEHECMDEASHALLTGFRLED